MKKQSILKKNVFKLFSFLTLFALTFFISCEKDLDVVSLEKSNAPYKIKIVYGENFFKEHPEIRSELKSKPQLSSQSRMISSEYNFEIDETKVQIIETEAYDVFTFEIERDTLINTVLENYILIQHSNDSIEHFIASYPYNIVNGKKVYNNEASISEITNPNLVYSARSVNEHIANPNCEWVPYFSSQTVYIPGERCGCHGNHFYGDSECDCPASPPTEGTYETVDITTWKYECYSGGGSSDNNGSNPSGSGSVGGSGGSNSNQNIITAPFGKDFNIYDNLWQSQTLLLNNLSLEQQNWWNNSSISTKNNILNYLNSNNNSNEALDFVLGLIDGLINNPQPVYTITDYPGKNDGMPFEWWKNRNFIIENLKIKNESNTLEEDPNEREILLFILYPAQALLHIKNSNFAIEKSVELVNNNILTRIHNGKADAFRHAYWNAFDTAQFGSYVTKLFTDAHEWNSGNQPLESQMDFYNNQIGRNVGENLSLYSTPDLVKFTILHEIEEGRLKYLTPLANHDGNNILSNTLLKFTNQ
jgi:hypothetical protein